MFHVPYIAVEQTTHTCLANLLNYMLIKWAIMGFKAKSLIMHYKWSEISVQHVNADVSEARALSSSLIVKYCTVGIILSRNACGAVHVHKNWVLLQLRHHLSRLWSVRVNGWLVWLPSLIQPLSRRCPLLISVGFRRFRLCCSGF